MDFAPATDAGDFDERAGFKIKFAVPEQFQRVGQFVRGHGGEKTEAADVDAEQGRFGTGDLPRGAQHRAVAAEDEQQIRFAREFGGVGADFAFQFRQPGGGGVADDFASGALEEARGGTDAGGAGGFVRVADEADALEMVSGLFQSALKILCCRRGRAGEIQPHRASKGQSAPRQILSTRRSRVHARRGR